MVTLGALGIHASRRNASSSSATRSVSVPASMSSATVSPSLTSAMGPPSAASGLTCPIAGPFVAPEKRPSVISATLVDRPMPEMADVGVSISRMPGPPFGPS